MLIRGDCLEELKKAEPISVDAVVTDPPYGLSFMGKKWDYDVPSVDLWREVFRVLKPGGHLLSFGGTRTYHRMVVAIEDAGFEIRDQVMWIYGSGFPKSLDVSKAIDKAAGAKRELGPTVGEMNGRNIENHKKEHEILAQVNGWDKRTSVPVTPEAILWQGFGTALKPANEPIVLARKPLEKGLTVAENVLKWGCGAINIDGTRIGTELVESGRGGRNKTNSIYEDGLAPQTERTFTQGRWPANVLFDESAAEMLPIENKQSVSRFFYVAKTSKRERNAGLEGMPAINCGMMEDDNYAIKTGSGNLRDTKNQNHHPTVKPIKLMEYLCKLVTPPGGTILDPFMGSGSTGCAAVKLGFKFIGIEREAEYLEIAKRRIEHWQTPEDVEEPEQLEMCT
jgi:DNA modification methylase